MKENVKFPLIELGHCQIKENLQHFYNFSSIVIFNPEHVETPCIQYISKFKLTPQRFGSIQRSSSTGMGRPSCLLIIKREKLLPSWRAWIFILMMMLGCCCFMKHISQVFLVRKRGASESWLFPIFQDKQATINLTHCQFAFSNFFFKRKKKVEFFPLFLKMQSDCYLLSSAPIFQSALWP